MSVAEPSEERKAQNQESQAAPTERKVITVKASPFRDFLPEEEEQLNQLLESAHEYTQKFNELNTLLNQAETEYRSMHKNAAINDNHGYEDINWTNIEESEAALQNFENRIFEKLDEIQEHSGKNDALKAVKEGIWTCTGAQLITISENEYVQFNVDYDKVSDLRSYSNNLVNKNPSPHPLEGYITNYGEKSGEILIEVDTENKYRALQRLEEGETLEEIFNDTELAEEERKSTESRKKIREVKNRAEKYNNPESYEAWLEASNIDRELDKPIGEGRTRGIY